MNETKECIDNINILSKRLYLMLKYMNCKQISTTDNSLMYDFIKEQAYNINTEAENLLITL